LIALNEIIDGIKSKKKVQDEIKVPDCWVCMDEGFLEFRDCYEDENGNKRYLQPIYAHCICQRGTDYINFRSVAEFEDPTVEATANLKRWIKHNKNKTSFNEAYAKVTNKHKPEEPKPIDNDFKVVPMTKDCPF
jgi:hypothetical protein